MQVLKDRIIREGRNLGNGILKVDSFINHQVRKLERFKEVLYASIKRSHYPRGAEFREWHP